MLASLGLFVFELRTMPFQSMARSSGYRHASGNRVGARAAQQFLGPGDETLTLNGVLVPEITGGRVQIDQLRAMAATGVPWILTRSDGSVDGYWIILKVTETRTEFLDNGAAQRLEFTVELKRYPDADVGGDGHLEISDNGGA